MDIKVKRNAFGTQIDSFKTSETIDEVGKYKIELVFIRAPYVVELDKDVQVLCKVKDKIVAVKQKNMLASSFHPELTDDVRFLNYFIENFVKSNPYN